MKLRTASKKLTNLIMGRSFEEGFIQGAMGGAVGGFIGYMVGLGFKGNDKAGNAAARRANAGSNEDIDLWEPASGGVGQANMGRKAKPPGQYAKNPKVGKLKPGIRANMGPALGNMISRVSDALISGRGPFHNTGYFQPDSYYTWANRDGSAGPGRVIFTNTLALGSSILGFGAVTGSFTGTMQTLSLASTLNEMAGNPEGLSIPMQKRSAFLGIFSSFMGTLFRPNGMYGAAYSVVSFLNGSAGILELESIFTKEKIQTKENPRK